jgi:hypothetical protein
VVVVLVLLVVVVVVVVGEGVVIMTERSQGMTSKRCLRARLHANSQR